MDGIHGRLLPDEDWAGHVRTVQNWIGGSDYSPRDARFVPPVPADVPSALDDPCVWVERTDVPAVAQAAIAHAHFETIHPYVDGNGRALTHLVLRRRHVVRDGIAPVSIAVLADRDAYFDNLRRYEQGDVEGFVRSFARSCATAATASRQLQRDLGALRDEWRELPVVADARSDATVRRLVEQQLEHPVTSAAQAAERCGSRTRQLEARSSGSSTSGCSTARPQRGTCTSTRPMRCSRSSTTSNGVSRRASSPDI